MKQKPRIQYLQHTLRLRQCNNPLQVYSHFIWPYVEFREIPYFSVQNKSERIALSPMSNVFMYMKTRIKMIIIINKMYSKYPSVPRNRCVCTVYIVLLICITRSCTNTIVCFLKTFFCRCIIFFFAHVPPSWKKRGVQDMSARIFHE